MALCLIGLFLGAFAVGTDGFMIAGLLPDIDGQFHTSTATAAQLVTVFALGYAIGAPVLTSLAHRVERRGLLVAGLLALAVGNAAAAVGPDVRGRDQGCPRGLGDGQDRAVGAELGVPDPTQPKAMATSTQLFIPLEWLDLRQRARPSARGTSSFM